MLDYQVGVFAIFFSSLNILRGQCHEIAVEI
jgi:hypothetical protein